MSQWSFVLPCLSPEAAGQESLYDTLQCSILASPDEIKRQFRRLALQYHPDKAGCAERFQAIRDAFEVLKDPAQRSNYDKTLVHCLDMQEYLSRFTELVLTVQGLSLPPHLAHLHSSSSGACSAAPVQPLCTPQRCLPRAHAQVRQQPRLGAWPALLTRA